LFVFAALAAIFAARSQAAEPTYEVIRNVTYVERDSGPLRADVYRPTGKGPFPAVLVIHGGAWMSGNKNQLASIAETLAGHGYTAVAIAYRLAPRHKHPAQIDDCRAALEWMKKHAKEHKIDPDRLAAWGYSAGAHLSALLGVTGTDLKAVVGGGTPTDFRAVPLDARFLVYWLGGTRRETPEVYKTASPAAFVSEKSPPMFFYHGDNDTLVPPSNPKTMAALLKQAKVETAIHTVAGAGHIAALFDRATVTEGVKFLDKHVKGSKTPEGK
jgi:acetyl esterase/lipase